MIGTVDILGALGGALNTVKSAVEGVAKAVGSVVSDVAKKAGEVVKNVVNTIKSGVEHASQVVSGIGKAISETVGKAINTVRSIIPMASHTTRKATQKAVSSTEKVAQEVKVVATKQTEKVKQDTKKVDTKTKETVKKAVDDATKATSGVGSALVQVLETAAKTIAATVTPFGPIITAQEMEDVVKDIQELAPSVVASAIATMAEWLAGVGEALINELEVRISQS